MKSAVIALLYSSTTQAYRFGEISKPIHPTEDHWNADPHSVPTPISGVNYMTSTQARFVAENSTANAISHDNEKSLDWHYGVAPYNAGAKEYLQFKNEESSSDSESSSDEEENVQLSSATRWHVSPDYGELDDYVVNREKDSANGEKKSGWTNPIGWSDEGEGDDLVLQQLAAVIRYEESEGPTKTDNGENDDWVTRREQDVKNGEKESGWSNPLGWSDEGDDDDTVL